MPVPSPLGGRRVGPDPPRLRALGSSLFDRRRLEFEAGFSRSRKGNLWRHWDRDGVTVTVTVFEREDSSHGWCVASPDGLRYSSARYVTESEALAGLWAELEGRG
jgi:hypothetical protein